jgi:ATP-dependent RNA helicase SUPV3L1/SUV3
VYCGPLRLLAWEIHERLGASGIPCNLVTGQEMTREAGAQHVACTVEMADCNAEVEVAVIDENQMIGSTDRGSSWTRVLLGLPAAELHVCGSENMVAIVEEMCALTGEDLEVKRYERLTTLNSSPALTGWEDVRAGDCLIAFSRRDLYTLKRHIESKTHHKCCIIYGGLPPEIRKLQATLFNEEGNEHDVLLASDAIGMGLNLNIGRIIFTAVEKYDGTSVRQLNVSEALQIGGRAGRKGTVFEGGQYTTLFDEDLGVLKSLMKRHPSQVTCAGLSPTLEQIEMIAEKRPDMDLVQLLDYFAKYSTLDDLYFMCDTSQMKALAVPLRNIDMTLKDKYTFCLAPASKGASLLAAIDYAKQYSDMGLVRIGNARLSASAPQTQAAIGTLEEKYMAVDIYIWLARHFGDDVFPDLDLALTRRDDILYLIDEGLRTLPCTETRRKKRSWYS